MRITINRIFDHPSVLAQASGEDIFEENEAMDALRQLRALGEKATRSEPNLPSGEAQHRWLPAFGQLAFERPEREMLLTAYGLRARFLPADLALLVQTFVEQDSDTSGPRDESEYRRIMVE